MIYDTVQYLHSFAREWYAVEGNSINDIMLYPNMIILYNMSSKGMKKPIWSYDIDKYHYIKIINHFNSLYITELELYEFMKEKRGNNIENQKKKSSRHNCFWKVEKTIRNWRILYNHILFGKINFFKKLQYAYNHLIIVTYVRTSLR